VSKNTNASPRARMEERRCERAASQAISGALERTPAHPRKKAHSKASDHVHLLHRHFPFPPVLPVGI